MRRFFFAVFFVMACATGAAAGPREDADSAFQRGDYALAAQLLRPFAEKEDAKAQGDLGRLYDMGQGVPQDAQEALKWYRKAAEQGLVQAQFNLGMMYHKGQGVPQDFIRAHMWYNVAAAALTGEGGKAAMKNRDSVASRMTAAQIGKAQELARRCQATKFKECD